MKKKIFKVTIKKHIDVDPDTSYLGKYTDDFSPWHIERMTGEFYIDLNKPDENCDKCKATSEDYGEPTPCHEHEYEWPCRSRSYRFFKPANHVPHNPNNWSHVTDKEKQEVIKKYGSLEEADKFYAKEDFKRMESLNNGQWCYLGIVVYAEVGISDNEKEWKIEKLSSGGLWGIESDGNKAYFDDIIEQEKFSLKKELEAFGFSRKMITEAFNNITEEEDY